MVSQFGLTKTTVSTHTTGGFIYQLTYPSTRVITYSYDAAGRATSGVDTASGINYATAVSYSPAGPIASMQNGATLFSTLYYDKRVQPCRISVRSTGSAPTSCASLTNTGNILDFSYNFGLGTSDNGNVLGITNNRDNTRSQTFGYDTMSRLATAQTTSTFATSAAHCWGETFGYDAWANFLTIGVVSTAYNGCTQQTLNLTGYISTNNQITPAAGYTYDLAGNVMVVTGTGGASYVYNAEGQMTSTAGVTYSYDGDGKRVKKSSGTLYWYGGGSDALEESDVSGNITDEYVFFGGARIAHRKVASGEIDYYFSDHLGTSRVVSNATGTILDDSDFYPFGAERPVVGPTSGNHYKFTGKERDSESGLDNFGTRYNSAANGRFMSPDQLGKGQHPEDPQSWNLYAYVKNNPLNLVDPTGQYTCSRKVSKEQCANFQAALDKAQQAADNLKAKYGAESKQYQAVQRAINAYGKPDTDNGVVVSVGNTGNYAATATVSGQAGAKTDLNKTGQQILVRFGTGQLDRSSDAIAGEVAHEGEHVADGSDWVSSGFSNDANPSRYQTESDAYHVSAYVGEGQNSTFELVTNRGTTNMLRASGWPSALVDQQINWIVTHDYTQVQLDAFSKNTKRSW